MNKIYFGDCFDIMKKIQDRSVDLILTDPPYNITRNHWDTPFDLSAMWEQYNRIIKDDGAILIFSSGMFMANLMKSNEKMWRYNIVWQKTTPTGFLNANKMPLKVHEEICVFYKKLPTYNPQKTQGHEPVHSYTKHTSDGTNYGITKSVSGGGSTERFPTSIVTFSTDKQKAALHPTQKPVALLEYLIRTYSHTGDLVLDSFMGSGSTGVACINCGRRFIGIEKDSEYYKIADRRLNELKIIPQNM